MLLLVASISACGAPVPSGSPQETATVAPSPDTEVGASFAAFSLRLAAAIGKRADIIEELNAAVSAEDREALRAGAAVATDWANGESDWLNNNPPIRATGKLTPHSASG